MEALKDIIVKYDVDSAKNLVTEDDLNLLESELSFVFGKQLQEYILNFGYLGLGSIEFYGINSIQKEKSDLISQTKYLHKYFSPSIGYVAVENRGEGDYALVDKDDNVYLLRTENGQELINLRKKFFDYIKERFSEISNKS